MSSPTPRAAPIVLAASLLAAAAGCPGETAAPAPAAGNAAPGAAEPAPPPDDPDPAPADEGPLEPWLGITYLGTAPSGGVVIGTVVPGSPAEAVGLELGERIVALNDRPIRDAAHLDETVGFFQPGTEVGLTVRGDEAERRVTITVGGFRIAEATRHALRDGVAFLLARQLDDGAWPHFQAVGGEPSAPSSALALRALAAVPDELPGVPEAREKAIAWLDGLVNERGEVSQFDDRVCYRTYTTALYVSALAAIGDEKRAARLADLRDRLADRQLHEPYGVTDYDFQYGSWNYNDAYTRSSLRADTSITSCVLEALHRAGLPADHPALARARLFLRRSQNWRVPQEASPHGRVPQEASPHGRVAEEASDHAARFFDGGFGFGPRDSKAGYDRVGDDGGLRFRSYGSATADGLRSLIYAREPDPARAAAARRWLLENLTTDHNARLPEGAAIPYRGGILFYYLSSLSDALAAAETDEGAGGDWARRIARELVFRQRPDGSWANPVNVMSEDDPVLASSFAVWTLARCARHLR